MKTIFLALLFTAAAAFALTPSERELVVQIKDAAALQKIELDGAKGSASKGLRESAKLNRDIKFMRDWGIEEQRQKNDLFGQLAAEKTEHAETKAKYASAQNLVGGAVAAATGLAVWLALFFVPVGYRFLFAAVGAGLALLTTWLIL